LPGAPGVRPGGSPARGAFTRQVSAESKPFPPVFAEHGCFELEKPCNSAAIPAAFLSQIIGTLQPYSD